MGLFSKGTNQKWTVSFSSLPKNLQELKSCAESSLMEPYYAAALLIPALAIWSENKNEAIDMINYLRGPAPLSTYETQFITERLRGNEYVVRSYFEGTSSENGYKPKEPFTLNIISVPNSFDEDGYATLYLQSSGADSPRPVKLRNKPSTGQWFLTDQMLLAGIKKPVSEDPWA